MPKTSFNISAQEIIAEFERRVLTADSKEQNIVDILKGFHENKDFVKWLIEGEKYKLKPEDLEKKYGSELHKFWKDHTNLEAYKDLVLNLKDAYLEYAKEEKELEEEPEKEETKEEPKEESEEGLKPLKDTDPKEPEEILEEVKGDVVEGIKENLDKATKDYRRSIDKLYLNLRKQHWKPKDIVKKLQDSLKGLTETYGAIAKPIIDQLKSIINTSRFFEKLDLKVAREITIERVIARHLDHVKSSRMRK